MTGPTSTSRDEAGGDRPASLAFVLTTALVCGIVFGAGEVAALTARLLWGTGILRLGGGFWWMTPLADTALILLAALAVYGAGRLLRAGPSRSVIVGTCTGLGLTGVLLSLQVLHVLAVVLLAVGVASQSGRLWRRVGRMPRLRAAAPAAAVATALVLVLVVSVTIVRPRRAAPRPAAAESAEASGPSILLIILDTVRASSLDLYQPGIGTSPHLADLADSAVVFRRAYSASSWTLPAHAAMFTGRWTDALGVGWVTPLDGGSPTLAEYLSGRGYRTGGFVGNLLYTSREHGLDRGFGTYRDYPITVGQLLRSSSAFEFLTAYEHDGVLNPVRRLTGWRTIPGRKHGDRVNAEFLGWLDEDPTRPFFAFLNYFDAHDPYLPRADASREASWLTRLRRVLRRAPTWELTDAEVEAERASYHRAIRALDEHIGALMAELGRRGVLDETIVVVTSDHGEEFREYGQMTHGKNLYAPTIRVPLLIRYPRGLGGGTVVDRPVSLRDLPATLVHLAGAADRPFPGRPLTEAAGPVAAGDRCGIAASVLKADLHGDSLWLSLVAGDLQVVARPDGGREVITEGGARREGLDAAPSGTNGHTAGGELEALRVAVAGGAPEGELDSLMVRVGEALSCR